MKNTYTLILCFCLGYYCQAGDTITVSLNKEMQFRTFGLRYFRELSKQPSFKEQQNRARGGNFQYKDASFQIVVIDFQSDSVFNSPYDVLTVCESISDTIYTSFTGISASELRKIIYIKDVTQSFKVIEVAPKGDFVKLEVQKAQYAEALYVLKQLPGMTFDLVSGGKNKFANIINHGKYIYVDFWATWCIPCVQAMPKLKELQKQFSSKLAIVGMNSEDARDKAITFIRNNKLQWLQGVSDETMRKIFQVGGYPHGVLFDPQGKLVGMGIEPEEVEEFLKAH